MHRMNQQNIKVAIIEDIREIRDALRMLIDGSDGFECRLAYPDAEAALRELPDEVVDVVLMDISLPGKSGIECMQELQQVISPSTQFMMCTVHEDDDNIFTALQTGATGYILKRTAPARILEAISDLHNGGSPMSSEIARRVVSSVCLKGKATPEQDALTGRENQILDLLAQGFLYKEIASELFISRLTVKKHIHNIYEKLQVQNRTEALNKTLRRGSRP